MNDNKYLSGVVYEQLEAHSPVVLASIVSMEGSSPRETGTKMVVAASGKSYGTIGGGLLEAAALVHSRRALAEHQSRLLQIDMDEGPGAQGMICGGKVQVLIDFVAPTANNLELFKELNAAISGGESLYFVTAFSGSGDAIRVAGHCLLFHDGTGSGDHIFGISDTQSIKEELHNISSTTILAAGGTQFVIDPVRRLTTVFCFGAGHVAVPTARIAAMVGFEVVVVDDRSEFANPGRFPDAGRVLVIEDFGHALASLRIDKDSYIVILTRGHKYDRVVLEQTLKTDACYIGMIGSRTKRDAVYQQMIAAGSATAQDLQHVHCPIGLPIGGDTPEEIAVSIVAEMIAEREKANAVR